MTAVLGVNTPGDGSADPAKLAAAGARFVRCVAYPNRDISSWIAALRQRGIGTLLVLARESFEGMTYSAGAWQYRHRYGELIDCIQAGNEADHEGPASWTMSKDDYNNLLAEVRVAFPPVSYTLVGAGMASGQPDWLVGTNLMLVDAVAAHPYAKWPNTDDLTYMLEGYRRYNKPLWLTEYDSRTRGMGAYLRDYPSVERASVFCWDDGQTAGEDPGMHMGLRQNPGAMADFKAAAGAVVPVKPIPTPAPVPPAPSVVKSGPGGAWIGGGLLAAINARGLTPITGEIGGESGTAIVYCSGGVKVRWVPWDGRAYVEKMEAA